jgi:hypothetical protein
MDYKRNTPAGASKAKYFTSPGSEEMLASLRLKRKQFPEIFFASR